MSETYQQSRSGSEAFYSASLYKMDCLVIHIYTAIKAVKSEILISIFSAKIYSTKRVMFATKRGSKFMCADIALSHTLSIGAIGIRYRCGTKS